MRGRHCQGRGCTCPRTLSCPTGDAAQKHTCCVLQGVVDDMARQAQQAQRMIRQDRSLTPAVCAVAAGPIPSIAQCLQGLEDIR